MKYRAAGVLGVFFGALGLGARPGCPPWEAALYLVTLIVGAITVMSEAADA